MKRMTSRERLLRAFRCQPTDRMPVRIWGVDHLTPSAKEDYRPLYELGQKYGLDLIRSWSATPPKPATPPPPPPAPPPRKQSNLPDMWETESVMQTPAGPLTQINYVPKDGSPGYVKKHYIETVADARKWLSLPVAKPTTPTDSYAEQAAKLGDNGIMMIGLGHAMYGVQALMGSEVFGFWLIEERPLLHEMVGKAFQRLELLAKHYLAAGIGDCYGWVGPELCIPPLASPRDFREFCIDYDKRLIALIHDAGKLVWVHCHGDMNPVLEGFVEMGVDCLNPIEPPPTGKLTLTDAKRRAAGRMSFDGGIEDGDFDMLTPSQMVAKTERIVAEVKPGYGFILGTTSSPNTRPKLDERHHANYRAYVETAMRLAAYD